MSVQKAYDEWSGIYDDNHNQTRDLDLEVTRKVLEKLDFSTVLEVGCGTGKNTCWLIEKCKNLVAMDFSAGMLKIAKQKLGGRPVEFIRHDIRKDWPVDEGGFDLVVINLVLEHIENIDAIFEKAWKALATNRHLFICELHPFRQYMGSGAKYEKGSTEIKVDTFTHHISDFIKAANKHSFTLVQFDEWFDAYPTKPYPRLVSFFFKKIANQINT